MTLELRRADRTKTESTYLRNFMHNVTSQFGEDGMIAKIFELIGSNNHWCVEFGAWDGKYLSNTWDLINNIGWSAILIEGDTERAAQLAQSSRDRSSTILVRNLFVGWDGPNTLDSILAETPIPYDFDLLSIDIDGNDWHVWNALKTYRPRLVLVEFNPTASNEIYLVQDPDSKLHVGSSLLALVELATQKGYELVATTTTNAFFVPSEEFPKFGIVDNSIDAMHQPLLDVQICHGYDGTIFAAGHMMLNWHSLPLEQEDFQVIPKALRRYTDPGDRMTLDVLQGVTDVNVLIQRVVSLQTQLSISEDDRARRLALIESLDTANKRYRDALEQIEIDRDVVATRARIARLTEAIAALQAELKARQGQEAVQITGTDG